MPDALQMLKEDHRKVQELFKEFEAAETTAEKKRIATEAIRELEVHAKLEEQVFYPAVWDEAEPDDEIMEEAEEEHHVAKTIMAELRRMQPTASNYDAKFKVLAENVKHHIQEEESLMLPKAAELGGDRMAQLGEEMAARKLELMRGKVGRSRNGRTATRTAPTRRTTTRASTGRRTSTARRATRRTGAGSRARTTASNRARSTAAGGSRARATSRRVRTAAAASRTRAAGRSRRS